jgi:hypothetical protein
MRRVTGSVVGRDRWARRSANRTDGPAVRPYPRLSQTVEHLLGIVKYLLG